MPKRWIVERTFAWLAWFRRRSKDYATPQHRLCFTSPTHNCRLRCVFLLLYGENQENHELRRNCQFDRQRHAVLEANQNHHQYHRKPLPSRHAQPFQSVLESEKVSRRKSDFADIVRAGLKTGNREKS